MTSRPILWVTWPRWTTCAFWILVFVAITTAALIHAHSHTTMPTYRFAATKWWAGEDPYTHDNHAGFFYFPQAAFLFTPFNLLPFYMGEVAWRLAVFGLYAYALQRLSRFFLTGNVFSWRTFLFLSLLAVPSSLASLRNAQFDLPLAALVVLGAAEIASKRWTAAAAWICLATALKPLAVVPLLLFSALYWRLIPRVAVGILIVIALPFLHWNPAFVAHEYVRCGEALAWASKADEARYSDLGALLSHLGYNAPPALKTGFRVLLAGIFLGFGWAGVHRLKAVEAAWLIGALSADYLMLFNPRTEACSFVLLGPFVASLALFYGGQPGRRLTRNLLAFAALGLACDAIPYLHDFTDRWFKPLLALLFLGMLWQFVFEQRLGHIPQKPSS